MSMEHDAARDEGFREASIRVPRLSARVPHSVLRASLGTLSVKCADRGVELASDDGQERPPRGGRAILPMGDGRHVHVELLGQSLLAPSLGDARSLDAAMDRSLGYRRRTLSFHPTSIDIKSAPWQGCR